MKNKVFSVFAAMAIAGTMVAAQDPQPTPSPYPASPSQPQSPPTTSSATESKDQSLTGCLVQGSGPTVFLLSDAASYVTGTILFADGGWLANDGRFSPPGF